MPPAQEHDELLVARSPGQQAQDSPFQSSTASAAISLTSQPQNRPHVLVRPEASQHDAQQWSAPARLRSTSGLRAERGAFAVSPTAYGASHDRPGRHRADGKRRRIAKRQAENVKREQKIVLADVTSRGRR